MSVLFRMAARCEAAGRPNNEDNFLVDDNLSDDQWAFTTDTKINLGAKGALLVVCDGMGGMNAGEVASAIAVATIREWFAADRLTDKVLASSNSIQKYISDAIQAADAAIKQDSKATPEHEGMGSTIVLAWLLGDKIYVGWCGDSRAYRYNPQLGIERLSHDHSYVQELVDAGKLTEELAFDHPNNNIITRSLGDPRGKAQPDTKVFDLCNEDIILLCSDGLCGCLRDNEIEEIVKNHTRSMQECRDALWEADEAAGWHDNVTILLAQVLEGAATTVQPADANKLSNSAILRKKNRLLIIIIAILLFIIAALAAVFIIKPHISPIDATDTPTDTVATDTIVNEEALPETIETPEPLQQETRTRAKVNNASSPKVAEEAPSKDKDEPSIEDKEVKQPQLTPIQPRKEEPQEESTTESEPSSENTPSTPVENQEEN